ncbi:MAG: thermonuclease family protein [Myxococcota bacterium]
MMRLLFLFGFLQISPLFAASYPQTDVVLDGKKVKVYFNDGDTFRVLTGPLAGKSSRIRGINSLESYGSVHQWGNWRADELFDNSKDATKHARAGTWHCTLDDSHDVYGRLLADCSDLSTSMVENGFAHVMFVSTKESDDSLIEAQQKAMHDRVGMWKKGVVDYILTSAHSPEERELKGGAYDRFVSTSTGLSLVKKHTNSYKSCTIVDYAPKANTTASTLVYVPFEHRYGAARASCL